MKGPLNWTGSIFPLLKFWGNDNFKNNKTAGNNFDSHGKMTGVAKMSLSIFVVFARFFAMTAKCLAGERPPIERQELTMNQSKRTLFKVGISKAWSS